MKLNNTQMPAAIGLALAGVTTAIWAVVPTHFLLWFLCLLVCVAIALIVFAINKRSQRPEQPDLLRTMCDLAPDRPIAELHRSIAGSLLRITQQRDPVLRQLAEARLASAADEFQLLGDATVIFNSTESWRVAYEQLLRSPGLHLYRSVSYIESDKYWQDAPGRQSTQLNLELHDARQINVERIAIIADHLWPTEDLFPCELIHSWLDEQHRYGIWLQLIRESKLAGDTDLLVDFGIYGTRATGKQTADPSGQTVQFVLDFNFSSVKAAESKWSRLAVYATSYRDLLDQQH